MSWSSLHRLLYIFVGPILYLANRSFPQDGTNGIGGADTSTNSTKAETEGTVLYEDLRKISLTTLCFQYFVKKPERRIDENGEEHPPKLRDAVSYYIRVKRVHRFILQYFYKNTTAQTLCAGCEALDLTYEKFTVHDTPYFARHQREPHLQKRAGSGTGKEHLGPLKNVAVKAIWCSFCKLIVNALQEQDIFADWLIPENVIKNRVDDEKHKKLLETVCYVRWQIDGQTDRQHPFEQGERRRLVANDRRRAVTRRILVECNGSDVKIEPAYIVLLAGQIRDGDGVANESSDFFGQHIETRHSSVSMMTSWLDRCTEEHGGRCSSDGGSDRDIRRQPYFGVIDLEFWNLTILPENEKYVAVSYCWGKKGPKDSPPAMTKMSNVRSLREPGAIERIWNLIPRTIRDAMQLARRLGMRYFWVDSLCIVQDSSHCWNLNANVMDQVYNNAHFTICAADGLNAWEGLKGLTDLMDSKSYKTGGGLGEGSKNEKNLGRQYTQTIEPYTSDTRLMVSYPAEYYINKSKWNTRAWTFQERLLSRRCFIFVEGRVFFQCRSMVLREDIITRNVGGWSIEHRNTPLELLGDVGHRPLSVYTYCVELYTKRDLTKQTDILNAFMGVGKYISRFLGNQGLLYGLPRSHFDWALLWQCSAEPGSKYRGEVKNPKTEETHHRDEPDQFPTWSWCGWRHSEKYPAKYYPDMVDGTMANVNDWLENHTWIEWYIRDGHGNLTLVWNPRREPTTPKTQLPARWRGYTAKPNGARRECDKLDQYGRAICEENEPASSESEIAHEFKETLEVFPFPATRLKTLEEEEEFPLGRDIFKMDSMRFLQFKTLTAYFKVKPFNDLKEESERDPSDRRWAIIDAINEIRGVIIPDRTEWQIPLNENWNVEKVPDELSESVKLGEAPHQFLALSDAKEFSPAEVRDWDTYTARESQGLQWSLYYVMLVTERRGVHYRMGLGKVEKEAFRYSYQRSQEFKEIILG